MAHEYRHLPPSAEQRVESLYAWIATHGDGSEGIVSMTMPGLGTTPLVSSKASTADLMGDLARQAMELARKSGHHVVQVRLIRFDLAQVHCVVD